MLRSALLFFVFVVGTVTAQVSSTADSFFARQQWRQAAAEYEALVEANAADQRSWYRLGYCLHAMGELEEALEAHAKAAGTPSPFQPVATYNLACAQALLGRKREALDSLQLAVNRGFQNVQQIAVDTDLASLRENPEFGQILEGAKSALDAIRFTPLLPAETGDAHQFDFWVGEWDSQAYTIQPNNSWNAGTLRNMVVSSICGGQAILEYATVASSGVNHGFSIRSFDPEKNEWVLILNWPSQDNPLFYAMRGRFHHGRGEFLSLPAAPGQGAQNRFTFSDIGTDTLRWDGAASTDGGRTWNTNLIFEFDRRDSGAAPLQAPSGDDRRLATKAVFRELDFLLGDWVGTRRIAEGGAWKTVQVESTSRSVLAGTAIETRESFADGLETFAIRSYLPSENQWVRYSIDSRGPHFDRHAATVGGGNITWRSNPGPGSLGSKERIVITKRGDGELVTEGLVSPDGGVTWEQAWVQRLTREKD